MNKNTLTKTALVAGLVLTPAVIVRYGAPLAELARADVLVGFAMVATLVALITLEYGRRPTRVARIVADRPLSNTKMTATALVEFPTKTRPAEERAAA